MIGISPASFNDFILFQRKDEGIYETSDREEYLILPASKPLLFNENGSRPEIEGPPSWWVFHG
jgi:hypothetical protein